MAESVNSPNIEEIEAEVLRVRERMGDWEPPTKAQWANLGGAHWVNTRVAYLTVLQPPGKAREIAESFSEMKADKGGTALEATVDSLVETASYFSSLTEVLWTAAQRLAAYADAAEDNRAAQ
jgi:hypothetical protein